MTARIFANAYRVREYQLTDLDRLVEINAACTPGVSAETRESLARIISVSDCKVLATPEGQLLGFLTLVEPGTLAYDSPNLRWFEAWQAQKAVSLIYVDRIAIAPEARGKGYGGLFYTGAALQYGLRDYLVAEVNTEPDNPGSHRFHRRYGFEQVGAQTFVPGKSVAYYALALPGRR